MKNGWTTKYDRNATHADFGIKNWMSRIGVKNSELQSSLINDYLDMEGFNNDAAKSKKQLNRIRAVFIQNRFERFTAFVLKSTQNVSQPNHKQHETKNQN